MNNSVKTLMFWMIIFFGVILLVNYINLPKRMTIKQYAYSEFLQDVDRGEIEKVTLVQKDQTAKEISGVRRDRTEFKLTAPADDPFLFQALHAKGVEITSKVPQTSGGQWLATLLFSWGP